MSAAGSTRADAPSHQATEAGPGSASAGWRRVPGALLGTRPAGVLHRHLIFAVLLAAGGALRVAALAGFPPALLVRLDSYDYLWGAVHLAPNVVNTKRRDSVSTVPDTAAFNPATNGRALRFGLLAIEAQPLAYARLVGTRLLKPFGLHRPPLRFPVYDPSSARMTGFDHQYAAGAIRAYAGNGQHVTAHLSNSVGTRPQPPFAGFVRGYQRYVWLPGPLLALVALAGAVRPGRRRAAAALAWLSGLTVLLVPIATHSYAYRFALPALPLFCLAAALAFAPGPAATREPAAAEPASGG